MGVPLLVVIFCTIPSQSAPAIASPLPTSQPTKKPHVADKSTKFRASAKQKYPATAATGDIADILSSASNPVAVEAGQKARVKQFIDQGLFKDAISAAKSYYNIASLNQTQTAVDTFFEILSYVGDNTKINQGRADLAGQIPTAQSSIPSDPDAAIANVEANNASNASNHNIILDTEVSDSGLYEATIKKLQPRTDNIDSQIGAGNLLLMADRPTEARACFEKALHLATKGKGGKTRSVRNALEGIAKSIRDQYGTVDRADAFVLSMRQWAIAPPTTQKTASQSARIGSLRAAVKELQTSRRDANVVAFLRPPAITTDGQPARTNDALQLSPVTLSGFAASDKPPPLEIDREAADRDPSSTDSSTIRITGDFDCGTAVNVQEKSQTHFLVSLDNPTDFRDWFMFRITGAAGKIIRIDIKGGEHEAKWTSLNPVFINTEDINDASIYSTITASQPSYKDTMAWNGSALPSTEGQQWHFIENCWSEDRESFSFVQKIKSPIEYVAMRIPRPPKYNDLFLDRLAANPIATVIEISRSQAGRPLQIVKISSGKNDEIKKPCVLIYAGEHSDEHDCMWVAQGMIENLVSDAPAAKALRDRLTFLIIPTFDPDATAAAVHSRTISRFLTTDETLESCAYANWFQNWVNQGNRLDIIFNLHNVQSNEQQHLSCYEMEGIGLRGKSSTALHDSIIKNVTFAGFLADSEVAYRGWSPDRFGGWLSRRYGPISLLYEVNSQARARHLTLQQLKEMGPDILASIPSFLDSQYGRTLLADIDARRRERLDRLANFSGLIPDNAIDAEAAMSYGLGRRTGGPNDAHIEQWIN